MLRSVLWTIVGIIIASIFTRDLVVLLAKRLENTSLLGTIEVTVSMAKARLRADPNADYVIVGGPRYFDPNKDD